jgi:hypothetical protein
MHVNRTPWRMLASALALAALAACVDGPTPGPTGPDRDEGVPLEPLKPDTVPPNPGEDVSEPPVDGDLYPGEKQLLEIANEAPGYAGHWYEGNTRVVAITATGNPEIVRQAIDARGLVLFGAHDEVQTGGGTRFVTARFDYLTLRGFRDRVADEVLNVQGVTFLDLDEENNTITVGIETEDLYGAVDAKFKEAGVPVEATQVLLTGTFEEDQTLQQFQRPLQGGWQIQNGGGLCTLGFITLNPRNGAPAFVTNSHCTSTFWGNDGTWFSQHVNPNWVGTEVSDPGGFNCGLFGWWRCRFSDAALVQVTNAAVDWNRIARTSWWGAGYGAWGSINVAPPALNVTAVQNWPWNGQMVDKVGRTSGWTYGFVRRSCVSMPRGSWKIALCQYWASYTSVGGDSGSPVFLWHGNNVTLTGINWGHSDFWRVAFFSAAGGTRIDLGVP